MVFEMGVVKVVVNVGSTMALRMLCSKIMIYLTLFVVVL